MTRRFQRLVIIGIVAASGAVPANASTARMCVASDYVMSFTPPMDAGVHAGRYVLEASVICYTALASATPLPSASVSPTTFTATSTGTYTGSCLVATFADDARSGGGYLIGNAATVTAYFSADAVSFSEVGVLTLVPEGICPAVIRTAKGVGATVLQQRVLSP